MLNVHPSVHWSLHLLPALLSCKLPTSHSSVCVWLDIISACQRVMLCGWCLVAGRTV